MTNAEKFEEVFGIKPDTGMYILACPLNYQVEDCKYYESLDGGCCCNTWWGEEYKESSMDSKDTNMIDMEEIERIRKNCRKGVRLEAHPPIYEYKRRYENVDSTYIHRIRNT